MRTLRKNISRCSKTVWLQACYVNAITNLMRYILMSKGIGWWRKLYMNCWWRTARSSQKPAVRIDQVASSRAGILLLHIYSATDAYYWQAQTVSLVQKSGRPRCKVLTDSWFLPYSHRSCWISGRSRWEKKERKWYSDWKNRLFSLNLSLLLDNELHPGISECSWLPRWIELNFQQLCSY